MDKDTLRMILEFHCIPEDQLEECMQDIIALVNTSDKSTDDKSTDDK